MSAVGELRRSLGLSQKAFADRVGSTQPQISVVERGEPCSRELGLAIYDEFQKELATLGYELADLLRGHAA